MLEKGQFVPCPALNETPEYYKKIIIAVMEKGKCGSYQLHSLIYYTVIVFFLFFFFIFAEVTTGYFVVRHVAQTIALCNNRLKSCLQARKIDCLCSMPILSSRPLIGTKTVCLEAGAY